MVQFGTDYQVMDDKARALADLAGDYNTISKQLRSAATSIEKWYDSQDGRTYIQRIEEACNNLERMAAKLTRQSEILASQAKGYSDTESDNAGDAAHLPS